MSVPDILISAPPDRREQVLRWRRRSRVVRAMRIVLPGMIGLILAGLAAAVAYNAFLAEPLQPSETAAPIRLVNPRFIGRDDKGRAFVPVLQALRTYGEVWEPREAPARV